MNNTDYLEKELEISNLTINKQQLKQQKIMNSLVMNTILNIAGVPSFTYTKIKKKVIPEHIQTQIKELAQLKRQRKKLRNLELTHL